MRQAFRFNIIILLWVCIFVSQIWLTSCRIIDNNVEVVYQFKQHLNVYPEKKIYHIGDTIWVSNSSHEPFIINEVNQDKISLNDKLINIQFSIYDAEFKYQWIYPFKPFDIYKNSQVSQLHDIIILNKQFFNFDYGCPEKSVYFNFGLIPKTKGTYILAPYNKTQYFPFVNTDSFCSYSQNQYSGNVGQITEYIYYFDVANNNGELISSSPIEEKEKEHLKKLTENKHIYWFKVD